MALSIPNLASAFDLVQAEPDAVDIDMIVAGIASDGVVSGCLVQAQSSPNMTVLVNPGVVQVGGFRAAVSSTNVTITAIAGANTYTDGVISSGSKVFTSSAATFTAADVGKSIRVAGAGPAAGNLITIIDVYTSAHQVSLLAAAGTTASSATFTYGTNRIDLVQSSSSGVLSAATGGVGLVDATLPTLSGVGLAAVLLQPWTTAIAASNIVDKRLLVPGGFESYTNDGTTGATITLDASLATWRNVVLGANCTATFTGATAGRAHTLNIILRQDATGSRTVTWPASVRWAYGAAPSLPTAANSISILSFVTVDGGTNWYGLLGGNSFA